MAKYDNLSNSIQEKILLDRQNHIDNPYAFKDEFAIRRNLKTNDKASILRSNFIRDIDKIINCPFYNRYADKTQVFSFYKNDDISRRSIHVQLVSRIARTIGKALNLNLELIEAISLGHDLGHTPFGHEGEYILDKIYFSKTNRHFAHNLQSIRVLDTIYPYNITLQTLDGIAGHNGEIEMETYYPKSITAFTEFDKALEDCYLDLNNIKNLSPSTLEGCVVRISDIIAYLGKDRQDGTRTNTYDENNYSLGVLGTINAEIVNNLSINIIENSYGKNYIKLDKEYFDALKKAKKDNYQNLYLSKDTSLVMENKVAPMMQDMYDNLYNSLVKGDKNSPIFTKHMDYINKAYYKRSLPYIEQEKNQIVVDFIASMTDDYFIELYNYLFPKSKYKIEYKGYFE